MHTSSKTLLNIISYLIPVVTETFKSIVTFFKTHGEHAVPVPKSMLMGNQVGNTEAAFRHNISLKSSGAALSENSNFVLNIVQNCSCHPPHPPVNTQQVSGLKKHDFHNVIYTFAVSQFSGCILWRTRYTQPGLQIRRSGLPIASPACPAFTVVA